MKHLSRVTNELPAQQLRCLGLFVHGFTYKEIGREMNISPRTAEYYMGIVRKKVGLKYRSEFYKFFYEL